MTTLVRLPCDHFVEVNHERGDRRVECACGQVYVVRAVAQPAVSYEVREGHTSVR